MMVLTAAQVTAFFEGASQIATPRNTRVQLKYEGITDPSDRIEFTEKAMAMISQNLKRHGGRIQDPDPNASPGSTIPTPPFVLGAKS